MKPKTFLSREELWKNENSYWRKKRAAKIIKFIDEIRPPIGDMGERNPLIQHIENELNIQAVSINGDFDHDIIKKKYGTIFCFALLEHVFNPLYVLENMKNAMLPGAYIYIATPHRPHFLWTEHHFHEIDTERIKWLFNRAGLEIVKMERHYIRDKWFEHLKGIRPLLRYFQKSMGLYKLKGDIKVNGKKQIQKEQEKLINVYGCYAFCPNCGWPSNQITGEKRIDEETQEEQSETLCPKCGEAWWSFL